MVYMGLALANGDISEKYAFTTDLMASPIKHNRLTNKCLECS